MAEAVHLLTALGTYPHTRAIKNGSLASPEVAFDLAEVEPIHTAFAPMVRRQAYELSELAIVTALQALEAAKPIVLLPAVIASRLQRGCLIALAGRNLDHPRSLEGQRIGVRAWTQTTGMWVRAALYEDAGMTVDDSSWSAHDPAHVEEYRDPPFVRRDDSGKSLPDQLRDGDIDAAILGNDLPKGAEFAPVIRDHRARDEAWVARHGFMPINHIVAVSRGAWDTKPRAVRAAYELLRRAAAEVPSPLTRFGVAALREPLEFMIDECVRQQLLARRLDVDEILVPAAALLNEEALAGETRR